MTMTLYELGGLDDRRYSLYSWRARYALAHKGLTPEYKPVRISDKSAIAFSRQDKVPILIDGEQVVQDSWRIAQHLEAKPGVSLFGGEIGQSLSRFFNSWVDRTIVPRLAPMIAIDVTGIQDEADARHLRGGQRWKNVLATGGHRRQDARCCVGHSKLCFLTKR